MTELSIEKVHSPSFNINNSVVPTWTSQQMQQVTPPGGSLRAGQRRLRIENTAARLQNNISPEALDALIKYSNNKENWSALNYAICYAHDWKAAEALIEAGIGINTRDGHVGYTPIIQLLDLATHGHPPYRENGTALLRKLIQKGIDLSLPMGNGLNQGQYILGETALFYCAPHLNAELELFLTKYKIDLNFVTKSNTHPIQMAIQFPNLEAIKTLIKHGAKINNIDCFSRLYSTGTVSYTHLTLPTICSV